ncbi:MAG: cation:proton antiporter [Candidatus Dormibacteraceae bacterium]
MDQSRRWPRVASWPPHQIALAAVGIALGTIPGLPKVVINPQLILSLFVPALVFRAALTLDRGALRSVAGSVALLALAGVAISIAAVAALSHALAQLTWANAFLLGAILSPTDPIAVAAVIRRGRAPARLGALLEGESLFNDAAGVVAYSAALAAIAGTSQGLPGVGLDLIRLTLIGLAAGLVVGWAGNRLAQRLRGRRWEVAATTLAAYASYGLALQLGGSAIVAVVVAGIAMAQGEAEGDQVQGWWSSLERILSIALFLLIGIGLPAREVGSHLVAVLLAFLFLLLARLLPVHLFALQMSRRWRLLIWWGGLRGALPVALALASAVVPGVDPKVPLLAYGVVALSLLVQGASLGPITTWLTSSSERTA